MIRQQQLLRSKGELWHWLTLWYLGQSSMAQQKALAQWEYPDKELPARSSVPFFSIELENALRAYQLTAELNASLESTAAVDPVGK